MKRQNVFSVADYFIKNIDEKFRVDNLKLNKLVYIAFGFTISLKKLTLFEEEIQAWKWGPVIPELYHHFKKGGSQNIDKVSDKGASIEDKFILQVLNVVKDIYEGKEGLEMVELTHQAGTPWHYFYDGARNKTIEPFVIKDYYDIFIKNMEKANLLVIS